MKPNGGASSEWRAHAEGLNAFVCVVLCVCVCVCVWCGLCMYGANVYLRIVDNDSAGLRGTHEARMFTIEPELETGEGGGAPRVSGSGAGVTEPPCQIFRIP